jgi:alcohol dehydrogenase, propanol-preferring
MRTAILTGVRVVDEKTDPLEWSDVNDPDPLANEILIRVSACAVCHTELDEIEGRTAPPKFPVIPGHQVIGRVVRKGEHATRFQINDRVGVAWIFSACGNCKFCQSGNENLCPDFKGTGRDANGGYALLMKVHQDFAYPIPEVFTDVEAAPLLCAGAIGYRSLRLTKLRDGENLGLTGFGASGQLVLKIARHLYPHSKIFVFVRNESQGDFALSQGADWAGKTETAPPELLRSIIDTTPAWKPIVEALKRLEPGGRLVINAIRKENTDQNVLLNLNYPQHLWMEKEIKSVANVTRKDVSELLDLAAKIPLHSEVETYPLERANDALRDLKKGSIRGAKVLVVEEARKHGTQGA